MKRKYLRIIKELRDDARIGLKEISQKHDIPISSVHAIIQNIMPRFIDRYVTLIDYPELGFHGQAHVIIKAGQGRYQDLKDFLGSCRCINSFQSINNGYHFMLELMMPSQKDVHDLLEDMEKMFRIKNKIFWVLEDIKREKMEI